MKRLTLCSWLSLVLLVGGGCASGGRVPDAEEGLVTQVVSIEVRNNLVQRQSVTVRIARQSGGVSTLGTVGPSRTATLRFEESFFESFYVLHARLDDGSEIVSREFSLYPNSQVQWRLSNNTISVSRR
jgi:hypothetical protein